MRVLGRFRDCLVLLILVAALSLAPAVAEEAPSWQIVTASGDVTIHRQGALPVALPSSEHLRPGDRLQTGPGARLVLRRGGDTIFVAPNSDVAIPTEQAGGFTRLLQGFGTLLVKIEPRAAPNFEVRTPYLTAVVKGTNFAVSVDANGAGVHVLEGQVQVSDSAGSQSAMLTPGGTARIGSAPGRALQLDGAAKRVGGAPPSAQTPSNPSGPADGSVAGLRITQPIALAAVNVERNSRGLVRNERAEGEQGRSGETSRGTDTTGLSGGSGYASAYASGNWSGNGNGNGNGNGRGNSNAGGNGNGNSWGHGKGAKKKA